MPKLITTPRYERRLEKFKKSHQELRSKYVNVIKLLAIDPSHKALRIHKLKGKLSDMHAVSINYQYRILLALLIKDDQVILIDIGSHDQLY